MGSLCGASACSAARLAQRISSISVDATQGAYDVGRSYLLPERLGQLSQQQALRLAPVVASP